MQERILESFNLIILGLSGLFLVLLVIVLVRLVKRTSAKRSIPELPTTTASNNQQFVMATFQGVIQRLKEQERELDRLHRLEKERADLSQKISENITRNMPTGLVTTNRNGIITSSNPAAKEILQLKLLENMHYSQIIGSHSTLEEIIGDCLTTGKRYHRAEVEVILNNSMSKTLGISVSPINSGEKEISGVVCLISDLTELVALQRQVRVKEGLAVLGEMSAGIAHEFKNSLAIISGYAQILQGEGPPLAFNENLKMIWKEASKLTATINEFLNFAKPQQIHRRKIDLCGLLEECLEDIRLDPRFKHICFQVTGEACKYDGDELLLRSAFNNLLLNAAEAVRRDSNSGRVRCYLEEREASPHRVLIRFEDNGCGISAEDIKKVFIPFFTTKSEGTGLGLAIVQKIILLHDGEIEIEPAPAQGTCFKVYL